MLLPYEGEEVYQTTEGVKAYRDWEHLLKAEKIEKRLSFI